MKILLLSEFFPQDESGDITGGVEARNFYLAKYAEKFDLTIVAADRRDIPKKQKIFNAKVKRIGLSYSYTQQGSLLKRLFFIVACVFSVKEKYDVVEGTNFITHFAAIIIGRIHKIKVILWYPDVWVDQWVKIMGFKGFVGEVMERAVLFFGKHSEFIAISVSTRDKLIINKIPEKNIIVIPCGVDEEEVQEVKKEKINKIYDLVAVNRFVNYKQTEKVVLSAIKGDYSLLIIGDGSERQNLKKIILQNNFQNKIIIIPKIKNHLDLLCRVAVSKVFVSASLVEGFDIAAIEAAALGLPCILSDIPAHQELRVNLPGILIFHSEEEFDFMTRNILSDVKYYHELSELNLKNSYKYNWQNIISATEEVYSYYEK